MHNKSEPSSPVREKKGLSWVGSVRRVISGAYTGRSASLTAASSRFDTSPPTTSPTAVASAAGPPRRAASDAGFWKGRRGASDWLIEPDDDVGARPPTASTAAPGDAVTGDEEDEDDWDVERAAEGRVVQLMFTVPRQRLRVVNADRDVDGRSLISFDESNSKNDEVKV